MNPTEGRLNPLEVVDISENEEEVETWPEEEEEEARDNDDAEPERRDFEEVVESVDKEEDAEIREARDMDEEEEEGIPWAPVIIVFICIVSEAEEATDPRLMPEEALTHIEESVEEVDTVPLLIVMEF